MDCDTAGMNARPVPAYAAVVLTGGAGERLGGVDKAAVVVAGGTLLERALEAAYEASEVVVVGHPVAVPEGVRVVREEPAGGGPAAGLLAGSAVVTAPRVVTWAVDMPFVDSATVRRLLAAAGEPAAGDGAVLVDEHGRRQLCLAVRRDALDRVRPVDAHGVGLFAMLAGLELVEVPAVADEALDVDTAADLAAAQAAAQRPGHGSRPPGP